VSQGQIASHTFRRVTSDHTITATFKNTVDQTVRPTVRFQVSNEGAFRTETTHLSLESGQDEREEWSVSSEDMVLGRFIFAKMFTFAYYPMDDIEQTCGILVLDLPGITGRQLAAGLLSISLAGMLAGILLWPAAHKPLSGRSQDAMAAMLTLGAVVILGMVSILLAWWLVGIIISALALILAGVIVGFFVATGKT
jgi:hypothetical protein